MMLVGLTSLTAVVVGDAGVTSRADAACAFSANLGLGSRGAAVRCLQATLNAAGYNSGPVDGAFGGVTFRAVTAYQRAKGLVVDGLVGRQTATALAIWGRASTPAPTTPEPTTPSPAPSAGRCAVNASVRVGSTGSGVRCLQSALIAAGYPVGPVDGQFGNQTRAAVIKYQRAKGLIVDGVAGRQTASSLGIWGSPSSAPAPSGSSASVCPPPRGLPAGARQVVVVTASGSRADVDLLVRRGSTWTCARTNMSGRVGSNGVRTLAQRRSGDGTTPGGIFPLGSMTAPDGQTFQFFGNGVNPGVQGPWRQVRAGDCWGATPNTADYNVLVRRTAGNCRAPDEYLPNFQGAYSRAALIGANMGPNRSGNGAGEPALAAAIFLHRHSFDANGNSRPTAGCVSLANDDLVYVLQQLRPGEAYFVVG